MDPEAAWLACDMGGAIWSQGWCFFFPILNVELFRSPKAAKSQGTSSYYMLLQDVLFFFLGTHATSFLQTRRGTPIRLKTAQPALPPNHTKPPPKPCHGPAHVFSCWRSSCYAYGLWRVLRRRPTRGGLGWFTLGSEWISCLLFAQKVALLIF